MMRFIFILFAFAFFLVGVLVSTALVRDPFILQYRQDLVIYFADVIVVEKHPQGKSGHLYTLKLGGRTIEAVGNLREGSRLIPGIRWPFGTVAGVESYTIVNNIWLLSFLRLVAIGFIFLFVFALIYEISNKRHKIGGSGNREYNGA